MLSFGGREGEERMKFDFLCAGSHERGPTIELFSFLFLFFTGFRGCFMFCCGWVGGWGEIKPSTDVV